MNVCFAVASNCHVGEVIDQLDRETHQNITQILELGHFVVLFSLRSFCQEVESGRNRQQIPCGSFFVLWGTESSRIFDSSSCVHTPPTKKVNRDRISKSVIYIYIYIYIYIQGFTEHPSPLPAKVDNTFKSGPLQNQSRSPGSSVSYYRQHNGRRPELSQFVAW